MSGGTLDGALGRVVAWGSMGTPAGHSGAAVRCIREGALECAPGGRGGRADVHSGSRPARPGSRVASAIASGTARLFRAPSLARVPGAARVQAPPRLDLLPRAPVRGSRAVRRRRGETQVPGGTLRCPPAVSRRALHRRARWRGPPWQSHARPALRGDSPPVAPAIAALGFNPRPRAPGGTSAYRTGSTASVKSCPCARGCCGRGNRSFMGYTVVPPAKAGMIRPAGAGGKNRDRVLPPARAGMLHRNRAGIRGR